MKHVYACMVVFILASTVFLAGCETRDRITSAALIQGAVVKADGFRTKGCGKGCTNYYATFEKDGKVMEFLVEDEDYHILQKLTESSTLLNNPPVKVDIIVDMKELEATGIALSKAQQ